MPYCRPADVAYFLDASMNQVQKMLSSGRLPQARRSDGMPFMPTEEHLVPALQLRALLDAESAELFDAWQLGEFEIKSLGRTGRTLRARSGSLGVPPA